MYVCKGIGIESCKFEPARVAVKIDQFRLGSSIWHEKKGDGRFICYQEVENGIWTKKTLIFDCVPIRER